MSKENEDQTEAIKEELKMQEQDQEAPVPSEIPMKKEVLEEYKRSNARSYGRMWGNQAKEFILSSELENSPPSHMEEEEDAQTNEEAMYTPCLHTPIIKEEAIQVPSTLCMQASEKKNLNAPATFELKSSPPTLEYAFLSPSELENCMGLLLLGTFFLLISTEVISLNELEKEEENSRTNHQANDVKEALVGR